ncbi:MAG TPA: EamA family transporter, partial [Pseudomonadota bacterium]|nr:EamA family transporter [Pseudomonadota bacterium]
LKSILSVGYLMLFGSVIGFTAFVWLLRNTTAIVATSYAYVNPLVAVLLGWAYNGETPSSRTFVAGLMVIFAVALITTAGPPKAKTA